jgi:23S rRNA (guanosine2251-2'-O)-methyltransferase
MADTDDLVFGLHAVLSALMQSPQHVDTVWLDEARRDRRTQEVAHAAQAAHVKVHRVPRAKLDQLAGAERHQGAAARLRTVPLRGEDDLEPFLSALSEPAFLLILDGVQDPHNLGACLRTADGAGVHAVIIPRDNAVSITATVRKVASGAAESVPVFQVTNLARTLRALQELGVWLVGTAGEAPTSLFAADLSGPLALVLGGEEKGLRRLTREYCDLLVHIPMHGRVESLNVSVAAAVCLYETRRQRQARASLHKPKP